MVTPHADEESSTTTLGQMVAATAETAPPDDDDDLPDDVKTPSTTPLDIAELGGDSGVAQGATTTANREENLQAAEAAPEQSPLIEASASRVWWSMTKTQTIILFAVAIISLLVVATAVPILALRPARNEVVVLPSEPQTMSGPSPSPSPAEEFEQPTDPPDPTHDERATPEPLAQFTSHTLTNIKDNIETLRCGILPDRTGLSEPSGSAFQGFEPDLVSEECL